LINAATALAPVGGDGAGDVVGPSEETRLGDGIADHVRDHAGGDEEEER
jgi:hypothetical protein